MMQTTLDLFPPENKVVSTKGDRKKGTRGRATAFSELEPILELFDAISSERVRLACQIAYFTAQRIDAVLWLHRRDLYMDDGVRYIRFTAEHSKTKKSHSVPVCSALSLILLRAQFDGVITDSGFLFPADRSKSPKKGADKKTTEPRPVMSYNAVLNAVKRTAKKLVTEGTGEAGTGPRPEFTGCLTHTFRRSRCKYLYHTKKWIDTKVMAVSGHESLSEFRKYVDAEAQTVAQDYVSEDLDGELAAKLRKDLKKDEAEYYPMSA